jgi:hypothetical protein
MKILFRSPFDDTECEVKPLWRQYYEILRLFFSLNYLPAEYYSFKFHHRDCSYPDMLRFVPYAWFLHNVNADLSPTSWEPLFSNKLLFNNYARSQGLPVTRDYGLFSTRYGYSFSDHSGLRNATDLERFLDQARLSEIVFKDLAGCQGRNIHFATVAFEPGAIQIRCRGRSFSVAEFCSLLGEGEFVIQEHMHNHSFVEKIFPASLNTFRVITFRPPNGPVKILGVLLRTGKGISQVDNYHQGGLVIPVDLATGRFIDYGYSYDCRAFSSHPDTGFVFRDERIPFWPELLSLIMRSAERFPMMAFVSWDIACAKDRLVLLEGNARWVYLFINQLSSSGMADMIREDLQDLGYSFPATKLPPLTAKVILRRISQVVRSLLPI